MSRAKGSVERQVEVGKRKENSGCGDLGRMGIRRYLGRKLKNVTLFQDLVTFPPPS